MIRVEFFRSGGVLYGFKAENHGDPIVCSAVSALTMNTVNCIERFTDTHLICDCDEKRGVIELTLPEIKSGGTNCGAVLLLNALHLGITSIGDAYGSEIKIVDKDGGLLC